jgi:hypothetical protein
VLTPLETLDPAAEVVQFAAEAAEADEREDGQEDDREKDEREQ